MKPLRTLPIAVLAASAAMMLVGASPATAGSTALCKVDENPCAKANQVTHLHKTTLSGAKAKLLDGSGNALTECDVLFLGDSLAGFAKEGENYEIHGHFTYTNCTNACSAAEVSGTDSLLQLSRTAHETGVVTSELEVTVKCIFFTCTYDGEGLEWTAKGPLLSAETNGEMTLQEQELTLVKGSFCPSVGKLDITTTPLEKLYLVEGSEPPPTALCSKDEKVTTCQPENQLKSIDYKDKAFELLTNLLNVKCEGLVSGTAGSPANPLEIKAELSFSGCSEGCFVTVVSGPGKILLQREGKAEEASATSEGFEIFVKCGTTVKCLLGPEKAKGSALGPLISGDNGHLTFSKVSMGKGEGATCPKEATLDALFIASTGAYIP